MGDGKTTEEWLESHAPIESGATLADGTIVGHWRIVAFVARGGAGEVYRAIGTHDGRVAALKILHRTDNAAVARFRREAQVLAGIGSQTFPAFYEDGEFNGHPWCATEFLQPLELPSTDRAVARLVLAVCRGAGALHALGYVHRDIKPANILSRNGDPVLIDLGLLKRAGTPALHPGDTLSVVDGHPVGVGTPGYAAPEQFLGGEISPAADIHAIGVLASTCFGGRIPRVWRKIIRRATSSLPEQAPAAEAEAAVPTNAEEVANSETIADADEPTTSFEPPASSAQTAPSAETSPQETEKGPDEAKNVSLEERFVEQTFGKYRELSEYPDGPDGDAAIAEKLVAEGLETCRKGDIQTADGRIVPALLKLRELARQDSVKYSFGLAKALLARGELFYTLERQEKTRRVAIQSLQYAAEGIRILRKLLESADDSAVRKELNRALAFRKRAMSDKGLPIVLDGSGRERLVAKKRKAVANLLLDDMVEIPGRGYALCKYETTQALWNEVVDPLISEWKKETDEYPPPWERNPSSQNGSALPVSNVRHSQCKLFIQALNDLPEVQLSGFWFRPPTAEEWEYACLAGGTNGFCRLADGTQITAETLGEVAWLGSNSDGKVHPVGKKKPNAFGLYDMHGNVAEYTSTTVKESMWDFGSFIWKGNAYTGDDPEEFRADLNRTISSGHSFDIAGFRLASDLPGQTK